MNTLFFQTQLPMIVLKEGKKFIAYTPALDLSTSGNTLRQVKKRFKEAVDLFFEEVSQHNTLKNVYKDFGWSKQKSVWAPPMIISHESTLVRLPTHTL